MYAAVVHWIVPTNGVQEYFIGYLFGNPKRIVEGPEPDYLLEDARPLLMQLVADRAPRVHPLSAYNGDGKRIILCGVGEESFGARVLAGIYGPDWGFPAYRRSWYVVDFKGGQWQVTSVEPGFFK
jgi:hypothetical protein